MPQENEIIPHEGNIDTVDDSAIDKKVLKVNQTLLGKCPKTFSLYVRAPNWIKERNSATIKLLEICPKIKTIRYPRQKSADYCFVDFATVDDRDQSYEEMKENPAITVKTVTKDNPELFARRKNKIAEKREAKLLARKMLARHETNEKQEKEMTNQIIIAKIPTATTKSELKNCFPGAVDINIKLVMNQKKFKSAIITFAAPKFAKIASQKKVSLLGQNLKVHLNLRKSEKFINIQNMPWSVAQENKRNV